VRVATGIVAGTAALLGLLVALLWLFQRQLIYFPPTGPLPPAAALVADGQDVDLRTSDGLRLGAWLIPPRAPGRRVAVLVAHGNGGDRSLQVPLARALADRGLTVLLFDYRGYAANPGSPTERGLSRDVRAAQRHLVEDVGIPADRIVYLGESLGAAVVSELATELPPGALVLRSPFVDLASVGERHYPLLPVRRLLKDRFPLAEHVRRVSVPITVVYGTRDGIVPPEQSRAVAAGAVPAAHVIAVEGADHNDPALVHGAAVVEAVTTAADAIAGNRRDLKP
jgi:fermentation-respiration switch protein FrsA (DUF1100 family)